MTETPSSPQTPPVPERRGSRGGYWAVAMGLLIIACLVLPILLIRSAMTRVRSLGGTAESALISVRNAAEAFATRSVETTLRSYATSVKSMSKFQFAELKQLESFERTEGAALAWGTIPLPDVVVEARGRVVYTYLLDFQKRWDMKLENGRVDVIAPAPEFGVPALDPSTLTFEIKRGSVFRDEAAVRDALQAGLSVLLDQRARDHLPLVRETGRKATAEFVRNFLIANYDDAANLEVRVRFADEAAPTPTVPVVIEGGPAPQATPKR